MEAEPRGAEPCLPLLKNPAREGPLEWKWSAGSKCVRRSRKNSEIAPAVSGCEPVPQPTVKAVVSASEADFAETRFDMRAPIPVFLSLLTLMGTVWLACRSAPRARAAAAADATDDGRVGAFSADRAWKHLEALAAIGPRASGTEGAAKARAYCPGRAHLARPRGRVPVDDRVLRLRRRARFRAGEPRGDDSR